MNRLATFFIVSLVTFVNISLFAQEQVEPEMADTMRSEGKIYVVVGILLIIFTGLIAYLVAMDRKVTRLETKMSEKKS